MTDLQIAEVVQDTSPSSAGDGTTALTTYHILGKRTPPSGRPQQPPQKVAGRAKGDALGTLKRAALRGAEACILHRGQRRGRWHR